MSIWVSWEEIGYDLTRKRPRMVRGEVRSYATGWSNHYPDRKVERPACIILASIPSFCVPGADPDEDEDNPVGAWLRLDVDSTAHDYLHPQITLGPESASVVMDETAVRALVADLTDWLGRREGEETR